MSTPDAWSHSRLKDFVTCPRQFHERHVLKRFPWVETEAQRWGNEVHKKFELRLNGGISKLPQELEQHEPYMQQLEALGRKGAIYTERRIALDRKLKPCSYFAKDPRTGKSLVWFRGIIDLTILLQHKEAAIVRDYKTGKKKPEFDQLKQNALWLFAKYAHINTVDVGYYWTVDGTTTSETYTRDQIPQLWASMVPNLRQYAEAFETDTWQERPSGLCRGWCPVEDCRHWKPRKGY